MTRTIFTPGDALGGAVALAAGEAAAAGEALVVGEGDAFFLAKASGEMKRTAAARQAALTSGAVSFMIPFVEDLGG